MKFKRFLFLLLFILFFMITFVIQNKTQYHQKTVYLNFNENPFGSSPLVEKAISKSIDLMAFYPDNEVETLKVKLADYHYAQPDRFLVGNGLSSLLHTVVGTFLGSQYTIITAEPTFDVFERYVQAQGGNIVKVPLNSDYSHDLDTMLQKVDSSTKLIYICNPNNPTGTLTPRHQIEDFLKCLPSDVYVLIDEAYHHFVTNAVEYISFIDKPIKDDRVIVGRTFSKVYGMAGMRLGYLFSTPSTIEKLNKRQAIDSNNRSAVEAGIAALGDEAWILNTSKIIEEIRDKFYEQAKIRELKYIPSHANFVMLETDGRSVQFILEHFEKHNIKLGREFSSMSNYIRVSLGLPEQMERFWIVWDLL